MPKLLRQVEQEVSVEDLNQELRDWINETKKDGVYLQGATPEEQGPKIQAGVAYDANPALFENNLIARDTQLVVLKVIEEAGIVWAAFYDPQGNKRHQFFTADAFRAAAPTPARPLATAPRARAAKNSRK